VVGDRAEHRARDAADADGQAERHTRRRADPGGQVVLRERELQREREVQPGRAQRDEHVEPRPRHEHDARHGACREQVGPSHDRDAVPPVGEPAADDRARRAAEVEQEERHRARRLAAEPLLGVQRDERAQPDEHDRPAPDDHGQPAERRPVVGAAARSATRCGWSSTSAFIDVFRRAFGHTPDTHHG
jgi:AraC-like DNA-binding protein